MGAGLRTPTAQIPQLCHITQYTIQNRNVHIFFIMNGVLYPLSRSLENLYRFDPYILAKTRKMSYFDPYFIFIKIGQNVYL